MKNDRDNFTKKVSGQVAKRAGYRYSNPECRVSTIGPSTDNSYTAINTGSAAHITAASPGGFRTDVLNVKVLLQNKVKVTTSNEILGKAWGKCKL